MIIIDVVLFIYFGYLIKDLIFWIQNLANGQQSLIQKPRQIYEKNVGIF